VVGIELYLMIESIGDSLGVLRARDQSLAGDVDRHALDLHRLVTVIAEGNDEREGDVALVEAKVGDGEAAVLSCAAAGEDEARDDTWLDRHVAFGTPYSVIRPQ
jgi:hypothetical protein